METNPSNVNDLISIVMISTYPTAFTKMQSYFSNITDPVIYKDELDVLAIWLYRTYSIYNNKTPSIVDSLKSTDLIQLIRVAQQHYVNLTDIATSTDYATVLSEEELTFIKSLYKDCYIDCFNILVAGIKYNALYHRIKDYFVPIIYR